MKFKFEKFIKDITKREIQNSKDHEERLREIEENPQRIKNKLYQERWQNSIKYVRREK